MLGKGLESLIPKKGGQISHQNSGMHDTSSQPVFLPVGDIIDDAERELPAARAAELRRSEVVPHQELEIAQQKEEISLPEIFKKEEIPFVPEIQLASQVVDASFVSPAIPEKTENIEILDKSIPPIVTPSISPAEEARLASVFQIPFPARESAGAVRPPARSLPRLAGEHRQPV